MLHWRSKRTQAFTVSLWLAAIMWPTFLGLVIWLIFDIRTHQTKLIWLVYRGTKSKPCNKFERCLNNTQHLTLLTVRFVRKTHLTKIASFYWYVFKQCHLFKGISHFMWSIPRRQQDNSNRNEKKNRFKSQAFSTNLLTATSLSCAFNEYYSAFYLLDEAFNETTQWCKAL